MVGALQTRQLVLLQIALGNADLQGFFRKVILMNWAAGDLKHIAVTNAAPRPEHPTAVRARNFLKGTEN
ncbi:hypothetical protein A3843_14320 [Pseudovibrio exalbescens]|uniref:Uncharacterized protein n=1 Tax=Pseudovibrio exalbescens TaxID=197461 RepID=A0A1U7JEZ6_9HYPH|nr:hypothetical protein A3843_14320 [Pseudovibrio exalbescens]